jgi:hypothetical protein
MFAESASAPRFGSRRWSGVVTSLWKQYAL